MLLEKWNGNFFFGRRRLNCALQEKGKVMQSLSLACSLHLIPSVWESILRDDCLVLEGVLKSCCPFKAGWTKGDGLCSDFFSFNIFLPSKKTKLPALPLIGGKRKVLLIV